MRYVLMTEPQQGMSYADQLAVAKRAEANGFDAFFRSDHFAELPGRDRPAVDRCLDRRRRPGPRHAADRPRRPRLAGDVPAPGRPGQGRHHGRRDERRADRGRCRGRLERRRASTARAGLPADRPAGGPPRGPAGHPPWAVGRAGRLVVRRHHRHPHRGRAVPAATGRCPRPAVDAGRRRPAADHHRWPGVTALVPARGPLGRRVQPELVVADASGRGRRAAGRRLRRDRTRPGHAGPLHDGRRARRADRGRGPRPRAAAAGRPSARTPTRARPGSRSVGPAGSTARRMPPGRSSSRSPRPGSSGSCSRTSCPGTST